MILIGEDRENASEDAKTEPRMDTNKHEYHRRDAKNAEIRDQGEGRREKGEGRREKGEGSERA